MEPKWLLWARELQAMAQTGLAFTKDGYDRERYQRLRQLAAQVMAEHAGVEAGRVEGLFSEQVGYRPRQWSGGVDGRHSGGPRDAGHDRGSEDRLHACIADVSVSPAAGCLHPGRDIRVVGHGGSGCPGDRPGCVPPAGSSSACARDQFRPSKVRDRFAGRPVPMRATRCASASPGARGEGPTIAGIT
jgi:Hydrolase of X-linked nucleoside diphosphate N terminal